MGEYKPSRYNHFVPLPDGKQLAFNALSCGLAEMDAETYDTYCQMADGKSAACESCPKELKDKLTAGGFLVDNDVDEMDIIRAGHYSARFGSQGFGLTIIPTFNCNFACDYCYEDSSLHSTPAADGGMMSDEVCENLVKLCEQRIPEKSAFTVTWYGGEPLLAPHIIERLTREFIRICEEKQSKYYAGMITNGYLLDSTRVQSIHDWRLSFLQITIDGPQTVHDQRRPLKSGKGTYDRTLDNIVQVVRKTPARISIRVNVDKRNEASMTKLLIDLESRDFHLLEQVSLYFSQTVHYSQSCPDMASHCMITQDFSEFMVKAYQSAIARGFKLSAFPTQQLSSCGAVGTSSAVIEPNGNVQNCWNSVGRDEMKTGLLTDNGVLYGGQYAKWLGWLPFNQECQDCRVLPLCMGGCPYRTLHGEDVTDVDENTCTWWKYNLKPMLKVAQKAHQKGLLKVRRGHQEQKEEENEVVSSPGS